MSILVEYDGMKLTNEDVSLINSFARGQEIDRLRECITLYMKGDASYAMFRAQSVDMITSITIRTVLKKKLKVKHKEWLSSWIGDGNTMVNDYMNQLESNIAKGV